MVKNDKGKFPNNGDFCFEFDEMYGLINKSLREDMGGVYLDSAPTYDYFETAVFVMKEFKVFGHRFNTTPPKDAQALYLECQKLVLCYRFLISLEKEMSINHIVVRHKEYNPVFLISESSKDRFEINYFDDSGAIELTTIPVGSISGVISYFKAWVYSRFQEYLLVLRENCSSFVFEDYMSGLRSDHEVGGVQSYQLIVDSGRVNYLASEMNRLKNSYGSSALFKEYEQEYWGLVRKYKGQDNKMGRWADGVINSH